MGGKVDNLKRDLRAMASAEKAKASAWFFKTRPGGYAEGDKFLGVTVPEQRKIAKKYALELNLSDIEQLLQSPWHEERLTSLFILVAQFAKADRAEQHAIYELYLNNTDSINNWDLVDSSAAYIVGPWLEDKPEQMKVLKRLAESPLIWERRIAMLSTFYYIKKGMPDQALIIAEQLLSDKHDLIHKAVGWMLREVGKNVDRATLVRFLDQHYKTMPRTALRYAIEHFNQPLRQKYLRKT